MSATDRPLRVLMTADCVGGVWSYAMTLCRALARHDVRVTLAITGGEVSVAQKTEANSLSNVDWHHRPYKCEWMNNPWHDRELAAGWLEEIVADSSYDLVHLNDYVHGGNRLASLPRLVVGHSDVFSWHKAVFGAEPDLDEWDTYWFFVNTGLLDATAVVTPTRAVLQDLIDNFYIDYADHVLPKPREVIPNAVELPPIPSSTDDREPFILCAGRVWDEAKNVRTLAEAAAGLPWPVKVAGDATHPNGGTAELENVDLLGPLPHDELLRLMAHAAIYALPAKYEPFGLSAVEAALGGSALVLGDIPSLREVWGEAATFVPPGDVDALRTALLELIASERKRTAAAEAARRRAETYTPERQAAAYVDLYRRLLENARP